MNQFSETWKPGIAVAPESGPIIEFFGLPGSGKTTVARKLHAMLSATQPDLIFAPALLGDGAGAAARATSKLGLILSDLGHDGAGRDAVRLAMAIRQPRLRDKFRAVFGIATMMSLYARLERRGLSAVLDQGLLQALWSVQLRTEDDGCRALVRECLSNAAGTGRVYVSVETPARICIDRLAARHSKHSRLQKLGTADADRTWERAEFLRRALLRDLQTAGRRHGVAPRIIVIDGTTDATDTTGQIVAQLRENRPAHRPHRKTEHQEMKA
ncbi:AAA family ATPase [Thalassovita aquimarina]|uniref:AAA family ATPase n=1 Tax=Thalassovita aquimarina TaxID=2785917 RepID=UPI003564620A